MGFNSGFKGLTSHRFPQLRVYVIFLSKGKAIPLQAWTDPEGSRKMRLPDLKTVGT